MAYKLGSGLSDFKIQKFVDINKSTVSINILIDTSYAKKWLCPVHDITWTSRHHVYSVLTSSHYSLAIHGSDFKTKVRLQ